MDIIVILKRLFFPCALFLSATAFAQDLKPAAFKWRILNGIYPYDSSGFIFSSSDEAMSDFCARASSDPGINGDFAAGHSYLLTCPKATVPNFQYVAESYQSGYTQRYEYHTIPPRDPVDYERAVRLDRGAFCDDPSFPVKYFEIKNGQYSRADCGAQYVAAIPPSNPPTQCEAKVGNPIDTGTGTKIQNEVDIPTLGINQIGFERIYSNANKNSGTFWLNQYQRSLVVITPQHIVTENRKSSPYSNKSLACTSGWNQIKSNLTDVWAQSATAQYVNETCIVKRNNKVVRNLAILPNVNEINIYVKPGSVQLVRGDGSVFSFGLGAANQYVAHDGAHGKLVSVDSAAPIAWRFIASNGDIEDYNADGKLLSITAANGMKQELFYDVNTGLLSSVKDSTGRELLFAYTGNQISSVTVDGNKTTTYTYNALGLITHVTRPDNTTRIYHYEDSRFPTYLTGITDERGVRYATWTYDAQGRAISSEHAGGAEKTLLAFNADGSTTVTNALNKQTIYRFDDIAGARRVTKVEGQPTTNCAGANQDYTYTNEGWIASKTDWKGVKTTYQYNTLGQEISRTEAFGTSEARTTITEWHPTLFVKTKVIEPEKETIYSYDAHGRLLSQSTQSITVQ